MQMKNKQIEVHWKFPITMSPQTITEYSVKIGVVRENEYHIATNYLI